MKRTILKGIGATAAVAVAIGLGTQSLLAQQGGGWGQDLEQENKVKIGEKAETFELDKTDGQTFKLEEHIQKKEHDAIVLHFFSPEELSSQQQQQQGQQGQSGLEQGQQDPWSTGQDQGMGQDQGLGQDQGFGQGMQMKPNEAIKKAAESVKGRQNIKFIGIAVPRDQIKGHSGQQMGGMGQQQDQERDVELQGQIGGEEFGGSADVDTYGQGGQDQSGQGQQDLEKKAKEVAQQLEYDVLLDENAEVCNKYGIDELPHAIVLDNEGKVAFSAGGDELIDREGRTNYLEKAIEQVLQGKRVEHPYGASTVPASAPRQPGDRPMGGEQEDDLFEDEQGDQIPGQDDGTYDPFGGEEPERDW